MAAPTLTQIMQGIETRLKTISGLRTGAFRPDQVNPPHAFVSIPSIDYHNAFAHGTVRVDPVVTVLFSRSLDRIGQPGLAAYRDVTGTKSIHSAIEGDRTLGGLSGCDCTVVSSKEGDLTVGTVQFYGAQFTLHVVASGA